MKFTYSCSTCDEDLEVYETDIMTVCKCCGKWWRIDNDAEFVNGMWRNLTTLKDITPS